MKADLKKWLSPALFTLGGALAGLAYYYFMSCSSGSCIIGANPFVSMAYMAVVGWLLHIVFAKKE